MNISSEEETTLTELLKDDSVILPADKRSGIVAVDKEVYLRELKREVGGITAYEVGDPSRLKEVEKSVKTLTNRLHRDLKSYLLPMYR